MTRDPDNALDALRERCPALELSTQPDDLTHYGLDWTRFYTPNPLAIAFPRSVEEVQALVGWASESMIGLVPSGGRTGLSGGACALAGEVVVSFARMNKILSFDPVDRLVVCQPGVITEQLQAYAREEGLFYPVDFAAAGSSQIGGNIATNAGGINVIRYGMTRQWVAGLKVVTGQGELLDLNRGLLKNNAGYDLRHLFIGSEGTLGFIVEATLSLTRAPAQSAVLVLGAPSMGSVLNILDVFQNRVVLSAFEFFSHEALTKVIEHAQVPRPMAGDHPYYALLELECVTEEDEAVALELFEACVESGDVSDGVMSQDNAQAKRLWRCREEISETISRWTPYKNDISVKVSKAPAFLAAIEEIVQREYPSFEIIWFGHIGDGNLHLNILKPEEMEASEFKARCERISDQVYGAVARFEGSISAEHGVGLLKRSHLTFSRGAEEVRLMQGIKAVFDPSGIMNPGKIFEAET
uniref:FAD/FMN-containing dehydrogenase n=1 Tax=uncultured bacterium HF186_25m_13D19 TaxID=662888 RepID=C7FPG9_9BACT|nr:FAD/FMN-containing dehydrogenase [uncultured bacterium HF186_25m_13D19]